MPRGGHSKSGPAPDPNALRRVNEAGSMIVLTPPDPDEPAPDWPLPGGQTSDEAAMWAELWQRPQSRMWRHYGQEYTVALYARWSIEFASLTAKVGIGTLIRQFADDLALTPAALKRNGWRIAEEKTPAAVTPIRPVGGRRSTRVGGTPALDLLARWLEHGVTFPPDTVQHADAVAELAARGIDLDPYDHLNQRGA